MPMLATCPQTPASHFAYRDVAEVGATTLRLGDVADLSGLPAAIRARASAISLPWRATRDGTIDTMAISSAVRAQWPALACAVPNTPGHVRLHVVRTPEPIRSAAPAAPDAAVKPGDTLDLAVAIGPVRVERRVTALQPARAGGRLFVADTDGKPLSVHFLEAAP